MKIRRLIAVSFVLFAIFGANAQPKKYIVHTVAFYNTENFYDTLNDPTTRDDEWVYTSEYRSEERRVGKEC